MSRYRDSDYEDEYRDFKKPKKVTKDKFGGNPRSRMVIKTTKQDVKVEDPLSFLTQN